MPVIAHLFAITAGIAALALTQADRRDPSKVRLVRTRKCCEKSGLL